MAAVAAAVALPGVDALLGAPRGALAVGGRRLADRGGGRDAAKGDRWPPNLKPRVACRLFTSGSAQRHHTHIRFALLAPTALRKPPPVTRQVWQFNFLLVLLGSCVASSLFDTIEHILHFGACQLLDLLGTAVPNTSTFFLSHAPHRPSDGHHDLSGMPRERPRPWSQAPPDSPMHLAGRV